VAGLVCTCVLIALATAVADVQGSIAPARAAPERTWPWRLRSTARGAQRAHVAQPRPRHPKRTAQQVPRRCPCTFCARGDVHVSAGRAASPSASINYLESEEQSMLISTKRRTRNKRVRARTKCTNGAVRDTCAFKSCCMQAFRRSRLRRGSASK
jgi:hypothetical protein